MKSRGVFTGEMRNILDSIYLIRLRFNTYAINGKLPLKSHSRVGNISVIHHSLSRRTLHTLRVDRDVVLGGYISHLVPDMKSMLTSKVRNIMKQPMD